MIRQAMTPRQMPIGSCASLTGPPSTVNVRAQQQRAFDRRIHDLVPRRFLTIVLVALATLGLVGLLTATHHASARLTSVLDASEVASITLDGPRNLSHWFWSTLLVVASLIALVIYSVRRHRADDYQGRYRVWLWAAAVCLWASLAETTDIDDLLRGLCRRAAGSFSLGGDVMWVAVVGTAVAGVMLRLLVEMRRCRTAVAAWVLTASCSWRRWRRANRGWSSSSRRRRFKSNAPAGSWDTCSCSRLF